MRRAYLSILRPSYFAARRRLHEHLDWYPRIAFPSALARSHKQHTFSFRTCAKLPATPDAGNGGEGRSASFAAPTSAKGQQRTASRKKRACLETWWPYSSTPSSTFSMARAGRPPPPTPEPTTPVGAAPVQATARPPQLGMPAAPVRAFAQRNV